MAKHLQCIVKLFALSCKSERETRAYELAQLVSSTKGIQALVNFASKSRRNVLSEKIAVFGRDNEAASSVRQDDFLAPKRVVMARRSTAIATETIVSSQQDIFADSQDPESEMGSIRGTLDLDVSMQSSPVRTFSKNPFKVGACCLFKTKETIKNIERQESQRNTDEDGDGMGPMRHCLRRRG